MLDTNAISFLLKGHPEVAKRIVAVPVQSLCISAITHGEILFGLAKRPGAKRLHRAVQELLRRVDVLPWTHTTAESYGVVRADLVRRGKTIAPLDLLIAAHAISIGAVLVTNDKSFGQLKGLEIEDWTVASAE